MLRHRVITAVLVALPLLLVLLLLPRPYVAGILALFILLAALEWLNIIGCRQPLLRGGYLLLLLGLLWLVYMQPVMAQTLLWLGLCWWAYASLCLYRFTRGGTGFRQSVPLGLVTGLLLLVPAWTGVMLLYERSPYWTMFLLLLIWAADIAAYFSGHRWGRVRLAPAISPGKSREGVYGALLVCLAGMFVMGLLLGYGPVHLLLFSLLGLITVVYSVIGDLVESMFKRMANMKDSGDLLPGHGGVLDRIDSMTAAAPVFAVGLKLLESLQ